MWLIFFIKFFFCLLLSFLFLRFFLCLIWYTWCFHTSRSLRLFIFLHFLFFCSVGEPEWKTSVDPCSGLHYCSSTLLLSTSSKYFISVIVVFHSRVFVWFFFTISRHWYFLFGESSLLHFQSLHMDFFISLNIFIMAGLKSLSVKPKIWVPLRNIFCWLRFFLCVWHTFLFLCMSYNFYCCWKPDILYYNDSGIITSTSPFKVCCCWYCWFLLLHDFLGLMAFLQRVAVKFLELTSESNSHHIEDRDFSKELQVCTKYWLCSGDGAFTELWKKSDLSIVYSAAGFFWLLSAELGQEVKWE